MDILDLQTWLALRSPLPQALRVDERPRLRWLRGVAAFLPYGFSHFACSLLLVACLGQSVSRPGNGQSAGRFCDALDSVLKKRLLKEENSTVQTIADMLQCCRYYMPMLHTALSIGPMLHGTLSGSMSMWASTHDTLVAYKSEGSACKFADRKMGGLTAVV